MITYHLFSGALHFNFNYNHRNYSSVPNCRGEGGRIKCTRGKLSRFEIAGGYF